MVHLRRLTDPATRGRDTPSPGLNRAAAYIASFLREQKVAPANAGDRSGNPYFQTFDVSVLPGRATARPPWPLKKLSEMMAKPIRGAAQNVVGLLPGTGVNRHEAIVLMAHYDHLGAWGDTVYVGADDNASGSSVLMATVPELVRLQQAGQLDRSIVLLWTAGEEKGFLGASAFCKADGLPGIPLQKVRAVVNIDMVGRTGADHISASAGTYGWTNFLWGLLAKANGEMHEPFRIDDNIGKLANNQDGVVFSELGIDTLFLFEGFAKADGKEALNEDYHTGSNTVAALLADGGASKLRRLTELLGKLAPRIANHRRAPRRTHAPQRPRDGVPRGRSNDLETRTACA